MYYLPGSPALPAQQHRQHRTLECVEAYPGPNWKRRPPPELHWYCVGVERTNAALGPLTQFELKLPARRPVTLTKPRRSSAANTISAKRTSPLQPLNTHQQTPDPYPVRLCRRARLMPHPTLAKSILHMQTFIVVRLSKITSCQTDAKLCNLVWPVILSASTLCTERRIHTSWVTHFSNSSFKNT